MPIYDFKCDNCGEIKLDLKMNQIPLDKCPLCKSENIERVFNVSINNIWHCSGGYSKINHGKDN